LLYGVVNDISFDPTNTHWTTVIKPFLLDWLATGRKVILPTETGANGFASSGASYMGAVHRYNQQIRDFARTTPGVYLFDAEALMMLHTSNMTINSAYSGDGTHINLMQGAYVLGRAFADLMSTLIPPCDNLVSTPDQVYANGGVQWFSNPLWLTTTGGTGARLSGSIPAGITGCGARAIDASATEVSVTTINAVGSIVAGNYGNDYQLDITAGEAGWLNMQFDISVASEQPGDVFYANCEFDLASGHSNFAWAGLYLDSQRGGVTQTSDDAFYGYDTTLASPGFRKGVNGKLAAGAYSWVSQLSDITIASGSRNFLTMYARFYFQDAGSATIKMRRLGLWRRTA
jgi:hypothetical protein